VNSLARSLLISGAAFLLLTPLKANAADFSKLYVFGDSLSDTGNAFNTIGLPASPYVDGRFSNGSIWIDDLAQQLELTPTPYTRIDAGSDQGINFAFGGATTGTENTASHSLPGLQQQIDAFVKLIPAGQTADRDALYIIWAGSNDYLSGQVTEPDLAIENLSKAITTLTELGADQILVANLPNLGLLPATRNTANAATLDRLTQHHNTKLTKLVKDLDQRLSPDYNLEVLDVNALFTQALNGEYGFTNVTDACFNRSTGTVCANPNSYLFWDGIHPTAAAHQRLEEAAIALLPPASSASVPTPALRSGFLAAGICLRVGSIARHQVQIQNRVSK
jgi:cholinesterase